MLSFKQYQTMILSLFIAGFVASAYGSIYLFQLWLDTGLWLTIVASIIFVMLTFVFLSNIYCFKELALDGYSRYTQKQKEKEYIKKMCLNEWKDDVKA